MSILKDLVGQIKDSALRDQINSEINKLLKQKKFGLVYEEHLPECTPLYNVPIQIGSAVSLKKGYMEDIYRVLEIKEEKALCLNLKSQETQEFKLDEIVTVAQFGEAIYPYLEPIDSISNAPESDLWHTLIEADNYHALQLLEYLYAEKVDCIYIDPPFNTGAKDWKYNNDYVDNSDSYKHSKWLSMMEKRLKIAKKLLNPNDSVLIIAIDEKEYLHLGCLLEEIFSGNRIQMISILANPVTVARSNEFGRSNEYLFVVFLGNSKPYKMPLSNEWKHKLEKKKSIVWANLCRTGTNSHREDRENLFYPIFVSEDGKRIVDIGDSLPLETDRMSIKPPEGCKTIWPIHSDGSEGRWMLSQERLRELIDLGYVKWGNFTKTGMPIKYLNKGQIEKIEDGDYLIKGYDSKGTVILELNVEKFVPDTLWCIKSHNASKYGTELLKNILIKKRFDYPKSLYAVKDIINFFVKEKPNALILDFFAGSGTTLHAVNLLNAEDGGHRKCILVTNNEVSSGDTEALTQKGFIPGDEEWEQFGIARYVTWPRTVGSIKGQDINGKPLEGNYIGSERPMDEGFPANAAFFKLGFLDKNSVELGKQFKELLPVIWMKAGMIGPCPTLEEGTLPEMLILPENHFAILLDERSYQKFKKELASFPEIRTVFFVTDSTDAFRLMSEEFDEKETYQLYRDYLDNFRINIMR